MHVLTRARRSYARNGFYGQSGEVNGPLITSSNRSRPSVAKERQLPGQFYDDEGRVVADRSSVPSCRIACNAFIHTRKMIDASPGWFMIGGLSHIKWDQSSTATPDARGPIVTTRETWHWAQ